MSTERAAFLLARFPILARQVRDRRDDLLERGRQGAVVELGRGYSYGDGTGERAARLADLAGLEQEVAVVRRWIDEEVRTYVDRVLLIQVWRFGFAGWDVVARTLGWEVAECVQTWERMVGSLARWLSGNTWLR